MISLTNNKKLIGLLGGEGEGGGGEGGEGTEGGGGRREGGVEWCGERGVSSFCRERGEFILYLKLQGVVKKEKKN